MRFLFTILALAISIILPSEAYRILGVFPGNAKSHYAMAGRLMTGLAERGHQVDVVSHFPLKKPIPNYRDIVSLAGTLPDLVNNITYDMIQTQMKVQSRVLVVAYMAGARVCDLMGHPGLKDLIENPPTNPPYDVVITEIFGANCYLAFGQHLKIPVIGVISASMLPWGNDLVANPDSTAHIPNLFTEYSGSMNFWQRFLNTVGNFKAKFEFNIGTANQDQSLKKYFGRNTPGIREVEKNVSLILVNSHYSLNGVRPFTAAVVEVGGLHIVDKATPISKDLEKWLDDSKDGFVYISFGSMLKIESLPKKTLAAFYSSLAKLAPVRVLMKIAAPEELPAGLPSNVVTYSWIPQIAVLKHKNVRAFFTHGGLMGTQEAIYFGVPMIGVPFFGDQTQNIKTYTELNIAVKLDVNELTEKNLDAAFEAVLHDPSYMASMKKVSAEFRDRPMSAMDTAGFWVEHVIRHGGVNLRSRAMDLAWWQVALLDVYGFLLLLVLLALYLVKVLARKLIAACFSSKTQSKATYKKIN